MAASRGAAGYGGGVKGWTKDGAEVELSPAQALMVRMLLRQEMTVLPPRVAP